MSKERANPSTSSTADRSEIKYVIGSDEWFNARNDELLAYNKKWDSYSENNLYGIFEDGSYRMRSEDLFESRMVIDPFEKLITQESDEESMGQAQESSTGASQRAETVSKPASKSTEKSDPANPTTSTPYATFKSRPEKVPGVIDKLRNRVSSILSTAAARLEKFSINRREGLVKRGLGRAADSLLKFTKNKTSDNPDQVNDTKESVKAATKAERKEKKEPRLKNLYSKIGGAVLSRWNRLSEKEPKKVSTPEVTKKDVKKSGAWIVGSAAVAATAAFVSPWGHTAEAIQDTKDRGNYYTAAISHTVEVHSNIKKTVTVVGGNYQPLPDREFVEANLARGVNVMALEYDANMGLDGSGVGRAQHSAADGSEGVRRDAKQALENGQEWQSASYSWGNMIVGQAYYDAMMTDPELYRKMSETPPVMYNGPFGGGGFDGPYGKIAMAMFGVNPEVSKALPKGTIFVYGERDPFSTSTYGNQPLTTGFNALLTAVGSHERREMEEAYITIEDDEGRIHMIAPFDAAAALGITGAGNAEINAAINKLFPMNHDPDSTERPRADVIGAIFSGAQGLDRMIDGGTGTVRIFETIQAQIPDVWKKMLDNGVNNINDAAAAVMDAVNNPTPENIQKAFNEVLSAMGTGIEDLKAAMDRNITTDIKSGGVNVVSQLLSESLGLDYAKVHQQVSSIADHLEHSAEVYAAHVKVELEKHVAEARIQAQVKADERRAAAAQQNNGTTQSTQIPRANAPTITIPTPSQNNTYSPPRATHNNPAPVNIPKATVNEAPKAPSPVILQAPQSSIPQRQVDRPRSTTTAPIETPAVPAAPAPIAPAEAPAAPAPVAPVEAAPAQPPAPQAPPAPTERRSIFDIFRGGSSAHNAPAPSAPAPVAPIEAIPQLPGGSSTDPDLAAAS